MKAPTEAKGASAAMRALAGSAWRPYVPSTASPWNLRRVMLLHRRAGYGATWGELQRDLAGGHNKAIDRLLSGRVRKPSPAYGRISEAVSRAAVGTNLRPRLQAAWLYRMIFSPDPFAERLTLCWHDHFATSDVKVENLSAMFRQNRVLRKHARGSFDALLNAVVKDEAMIVFLDAESNRKGHPNENLARELMELFTIGIGNYEESDVKEGARALTGWEWKRGRFLVRPQAHDDGTKTLLGERGRFTGDDFIGMLLAHERCARRVVGRLCELLLGENVASDDDIAKLAASVRARGGGLDLGWTAETIVRSELFFSEKNLRSRVLDPTGFIVGAVRALERLDPPVSTLRLAEWLKRLGQELYCPPNVGGWPGGRVWLATRSLIGRANFASAVTGTSGVGLESPYDPVALMNRYGIAGDIDRVASWHAELFMGYDPGGAWRRAIIESAGPVGDDPAARARRVVAGVLASPEAQVT